MYQLIIVGGGPGGVAAGIYAARKKIKTLLITETFGGQSLVAADIQNWVGIQSISGFDLAKNLEDHLRAQKDVEVADGDLVLKVDKISGGFKVSTKKGKIFETQRLLVISGSRRKRLDIPGEATHEGRGVVYCSICDAPLFNDKTVAVVGGGNAGLEAVVDLLPYAKKIYLLNRSDRPKGDPVTLDKIKKSPKFELIINAEPKEVLGEKTLTGIKYLDRATSEMKELSVEGVFVEIGIIPNSEFVKELVKTDNLGNIIVDPKNQRTSCNSIWAAGDVTDAPYRQNNISVGDSIKAVLNIYAELNQANK